MATGVSSARAQAQVPWSQVGVGWELITSETTATHWTLYLVSRTGAKYALRTWSAGPSGTLADWSGDKTRALFYDDETGKVTQLNLMTGKTNTLSPVPRASGWSAKPAGSSGT